MGRLEEKKRCNWGWIEVQSEFQKFRSLQFSKQEMIETAKYRVSINYQYPQK